MGHVLFWNMIASPSDHKMIASFFRKFSSILAGKIAGLKCLLLCLRERFCDGEAFPVLWKAFFHSILFNVFLFFRRKLRFLTIFPSFSFAPSIPAFLFCNPPLTPFFALFAFGRLSWKYATVRTSVNVGSFMHFFEIIQSKDFAPTFGGLPLSINASNDWIQGLPNASSKEGVQLISSGDAISKEVLEQCIFMSSATLGYWSLTQSDLLRSCQLHCLSVSTRRTTEKLRSFSYFFSASYPFLASTWRGEGTYRWVWRVRAVVQRPPSSLCRPLLNFQCFQIPCPCVAKQ